MATAHVCTRMTQIRDPTVRPPQPNPENALQARIAELEDELRARDDFLAIAAHELRNPMTPIIARVEMLLARARSTPENVPKDIAQGLERLEQLVDAYVRRATVLLDVSRITSGNLRLQITEVDLSALLRRVTFSMMPLAERGGCHMRFTAQEGIIARCDGMAVEQIMENLLSNAIRYGSGRPVEVTCTSNGEVARDSGQRSKPYLRTFSQFAPD